MMLKTQQLVHDMMVALELPLPNEDGPGVRGLNFELLRNLVREEADEFCDWMVQLEAAVAEGRPYVAEWSQVIDAICDLIVVIHNTSNAMGIDVEPFFDEVHRTNMAKVGGGKRYDGKAMKPDDWQPPRILEMLEELVELKEHRDLARVVVEKMEGTRKERRLCPNCGMNLHPMDEGRCRFCAIAEENRRAASNFEEAARNPNSVAARMKLLTLRYEALSERQLLQRIVTLNGVIQHEAPDGDFVMKDGLPFFDSTMCAKDVVKIIDITIPPTPIRTFEVRPTAAWVAASNAEHNRIGPDALTADQFCRNRLMVGEHELVEIDR